MSNNTIPNMDTLSADELMEFWAKYHRPSRKAAAELVGDKRKGYTNIASLLANYACNRAVALRCRLEGNIGSAEIYEIHMDSCYSRIPQDLKW